MTHRLAGDGMHDADEERPSHLVRKLKVLVFSEKAIFSILLAILTTMQTWIIKLQLDTRDTVAEIKATLNHHAEKISEQEHRITAQESNGISIAIMQDRIKLIDERLQEHTRAIVTAEDILHRMSEKISELNAHDSANEERHVAIERRITQLWGATMAPQEHHQQIKGKSR